jgi:hypothetical protein
VQRDGGGLVDPRPARVRHDDLQVREVRREVVDRRRVRVADPGAHAARHARAHAGGADVDHHGGAFSSLITSKSG